MTHDATFRRIGLMLLSLLALAGWAIAILYDCNALPLP